METRIDRNMKAIEEQQKELMKLMKALVMEIFSLQQQQPSATRRPSTVEHPKADPKEGMRVRDEWDEIADRLEELRERCQQCPHCRITSPSEAWSACKSEPSKLSRSIEEWEDRARMLFPVDTNYQAGYEEGYNDGHNSIHVDYDRRNQEDSDGSDGIEDHDEVEDNDEIVYHDEVEDHEEIEDQSLEDHDEIESLDGPYEEDHYQQDDSDDHYDCQEEGDY